MKKILSLSFLICCILYNLGETAIFAQHLQQWFLIFSVYSIPFLIQQSQLKSNQKVQTTNTHFSQGTVLASFVDPRSFGFSGFPWGSCTEYVARQRPDLFVYQDGTRRLTGNAQDRLRNAQRLWLETGKFPQQGAIAVYYEWRGWRQYGHVAYVEHIQNNDTIIVSEMNYQQDHVVTYRVIDADLAAGYIY